MEDLIRYCQPKGELPGLVGSKSGSILVIGSASCVTHDLNAYDKLHNGERMLINDMIPVYRGKAEHVASLHPAKLYMWARVRKDKPLAHSTHRAGEWPPEIWNIHADGGTSGLFGVIISFLMGFDSVVLAGIPVSDEQKITGQVGGISAETMRQEWMRFAPFFGDKVKSLSGWTREQFGAPECLNPSM
jgi:hypothetical protein